MLDSPLPFRPRVPTSGDRALGNVETQASRVRQRVNRFTLQRVLYVAGGAILLAFSTLVTLAFVLRGRGWAAVVWSLAAVLAAAVVASLHRAYRAWIRRADAAVVIDHRAALEDRLATLSALSDEPRRSRLWDFLLHENLRLLPNWEPARLQPRAVPHSVWFFLFSLCVALLTLGSNPGLIGSGGSFPMGDEGENPLVGSEAGDSGAAAAGDGEGSVLSKLPEKIRQAIVGGMEESAEANRSPGEKGSEQTGGPSIAMSESDRRAAGAKSAAPGAAPGQRSGQVQSAEGMKAPNAKAAKQAAAGAGKSSAAAAKASSQPAHGEGPKALERVEVGKPQQPANRRPQGKGQPPSGSGSGGGSGLGGDAGGLYGEKDAAGKSSGSFAFDLDAIQNRQPNKDGEDPGGGARPASRLGSEQRLDDAIRRAQVPAEYEKIVQRIFSRGDEAPTAGVRP